MIKHLIILTGVVMLFSCGGAEEPIQEVKQEGYLIEAQFDTLNFDSAHLAYWEGGEFIRVQSAAITEGKFTIQGKVESPKMYAILCGENRDDRMYLFLENSKIGIHGKSLKDKDKIVEGSQSHSDYLAFTTKDSEYDNEMRSHFAAYDALEEEDEKGQDSLNAIFNEIDSLRAEFVKSYISEKKNSVAAAYVLYVNSYRFELEELENNFNAFAEDVKSSEYGTIINDKIIALNNTKIGKSAPEFTMKDVEGNDVSLAHFKGKYLLIDFWASWCGPCRAENPNVVEAYKAFNEKGLEILGVSLDDDREKWLGAIAEDGLTWKQVSDLNGWDCEPVKTYAVSSIPHSVLLDPEGIIVAKNLRDKELHEKLTDLMGGS